MNFAEIRMYNKKIIIFGVGIYGVTLAIWLNEANIEILGFADNNSSKWNKLVFGDKKCLDFSRIPQDAYIMIAIEKKHMQLQVERQLQQLGLHYCSDLQDKIFRFMQTIDDELYLKKIWFSKMGYEINLDNPLSFNEKIQWLKLYDRKEEYIDLVDKYEVRKYVAKKIGEQYLVPILGVWDSAQEIDFKSLGNKFVLKCTHDSGSTKIVEDIDTINKKEIVDFLEKRRNRNFYWITREWPYKNVQARIMAEKFLETDEDELLDYKFLCSRGKVYYIFVCSNRFSGNGLCVNFYDKEWNPLPFERHYPRRNKEIEKPIQYDHMIELAETLSEGLNFVRVDFYIVKENVYFSELTFYPGSGWEEFTPINWDYKLGKMIEIE